MGKRSRVWKRLFVGVLSAALILQNVSPIAEVRAEDAENERILAESLLAMKDKYPEGAFAFSEANLHQGEGKKTTLVLLRKGDTSGEASVSLRAVDISAMYGQDYLMKVRENAFMTKMLEVEEGHTTILEQQAQVEAQKDAAAAEGEEVQKDAAATEGEEAQKDAAVTEGEEAQEDAVATEGEATQKDAAATEGEATQKDAATTEGEATQKDAATTEGEATQKDAAATEGEAAKKASPQESRPVELLLNGEAGESRLDEEKDAKKKYRTPEGKSSLQAARDVYLGEESEWTSWREIEKTEKEYEEIRKIAETGGENLEKFAEKIDGIKYDFTFKPGEYKKEIEIEILDDTVSESEEQVLFLLYGAENGVLGDVTTAYLNLQDNEEKVESVFEMAQSEVYVGQDEPYAEVTIKRTAGETRLASVIVGTSADTAAADKDYKVFQEDVLFLQGVTERKIQIPILNSGSFEEKKFYVGLKEKGSEVAEGKDATCVHIVSSQNKARTMARNGDDGNVSAKLDTTYVESWGYWTRSSEINVATNLNLETADKVTVYYNSAVGERNWTTGDCDPESHNAQDAKIYATLCAGTQKKELSFQRGWKRNDLSFTFHLDDSMKKKDAKITFAIQPVGENNYAGASVTTVVIHYPSYSFKVKNVGNTYREKIFHTDGAYTEGDKLKLGNVYVGEDAESVTVRNSSKNAISLKSVLDTTTKNASGIRVSDENTELRGVRLVNGRIKSDLLNLSDIRFTQSFLNKYKKYMYSEGGVNTFLIEPEFAPKETSVFYANTEKNEKGNTYSYRNDKDGELVKYRALDTIRLQVNSNEKRKSVKQVYAATAALNQKKLSSEKAYAAMTTAIQKGGGLLGKAEGSYGTNKIVGSYSLTLAEQCVVKREGKSPERISIAPTQDLYVYAVTDVPTITVKALKNGANLEKVPTVGENETLTNQYIGAVMYRSDKEQLAGDPEHPMVLEGVVRNMPVTISSVTQEGYKTTWYERTGDTNDDGMVSAEEREALEGSDAGSYRGMSPISSNHLDFTPTLANTLLCYDFRPITSTVSGIVSGMVMMQGKALFTGEAFQKPLGDASVLVDGKTTSTQAGTGFFMLSDRSFEPSDYLLVNITYNGITYTAIQNPNSAQRLVLNAFKTIGVVEGSQVVTMEEEDNGEKRQHVISPNEITNGNHKYTLRIQAASDQASVYPAKAVLRFYKEDGTVAQKLTVEQKVINDVKNTGVFEFSFNPKELGLGKGTRLTMQFIDQQGVGYYEHETGISLKASLGVVDFANSFSFGGSIDGVVGSLIGTIDTTFDLGWSGNFDSGKDITLEKIDGEDVKTITLGFAYNSGDGLGSLYKKDIAGIKKLAIDKANLDTEQGDNKRELAELSEKYAKADEKDKKDIEKKIKKKSDEIEKKEAEIEKAEKKYNDAVKENDQKKKTSVELALDAVIDVGVSLVIRTGYDAKQQEWYFYDMTAMASAAGGVDTKFVFATPVGLDIMLTVNVGLDESKIAMVVSQRDEKKYYIKPPKEGETDVVKIDVFDADMDNNNRQFDYYGTFHVQPRLKLTGEVGWDLISTSIGADATALFDLLYYTDPAKKDSQVLKINGGLFVKILTFTKRWDLGTSKITLGGSKSARNAALLDAFSNDSVLYESVGQLQLEGRPYLEERTEWSGGKKSRRAMSEFNEQILRGGVYPQPDVQFANLGNDRFLAVFVDAVPERKEVNGTAIYYSIYEKGSWSKAKIIDDDGTLDDSPTISDLGKKGVMVAWSSAGQVFDSNATAIDVLESRNIKTALFNKESLTFGKTQEATKTTEEDVTADVQPIVSYFKHNGQERMLMFYFKNEYERNEGEAGLIGDALNPYSVAAYMYYDFDTNTWRHSYTEEEKEEIISGGALVNDTTIEDYEKNWYGQGFLSLAPIVNITETLDEAGYWKENPVITENTAAQTGIVTESDIITYNGLALYTYVLDRDGNLQSEHDRDIYMQIYDYEENEFVHPIMITSNDVEEKGVKFARVGNETLLTWIADNKIQVLHASSMFWTSGEQTLDGKLEKMGLEKATAASGQSYYYINKSREGKYRPPYTIEAYADSVTKEETDNTGGLGRTDGVNGSEVGRAINSFDIQSNGTDAYILWTESSNMLKEGIAPDSDEAKKQENYTPQTQIYGSRMDGRTGSWSGRVQVTTEDMAHYSNLDFAVTSDNRLLVMAAKGQSTEVIDSETGTAYASEDKDHRKLVSLLVKPGGKPSLSEFEVQNPEEGVETTGKIRVSNESFQKAENVSLVISDESGAKLLEKQIGEMQLGQSDIYSFSYTLPEGKENWKITARLKAGNEVIEEQMKEGSVPISLVVEDAVFTQTTGRHDVEGNITVRNASARKLPKGTKVRIRTKEDGNELLALEVPEMKAGESKTIQTSFKVQDNLFVRGQNEAGDTTETLNLYVVGTNESLKRQIVRTTPKAYMEKLNSVEEFTLNQGKNVKMKTGEFYEVKPEIRSKLFTLDKYATYKNHGLQILWASEDSSIASIDVNGKLRGMKKGTTTVHGYLLPATDMFTFNDENNSVPVSNYLTVTSDAMKKLSLQVEVTDGAGILGGGDTSQDSADGNTENRKEQNSAAKTGDMSQPYLWLLLMMTAAAGIAGYVYKKKRNG